VLFHQNWNEQHAACNDFSLTNDILLQSGIEIAAALTKTT